MLLLTILTTALHADIRYMVDYLLPRGAQRGTTITVEFRGASLESPREILFYRPGITASDFTPLARPADGFKAKFHMAPNCPLGEHVLRVRTATALSDAVTFWVSPFPTILESESKVGDNDTIAKAKSVPLNSTVEGQILPSQDMDIDVYRIETQQGQRISIEVEAARLGTLHYQGENDLAVRILDAEGHQLGKNDDSALYVQDPVLSILAPRTGVYYIEIRQQLFQPPRQAWYRAHIGTFLRPTAIFPAGGEAGATISARILGDPAGERTQAITLPAAPGNFEYFGEAPSANILRVSPYPNVVFTSSPTSATLPAALNGILEKPGESQTFQFAAKRGQSWRIQVFSRTLGAPVDPKIWIRAANNPRNLAEADDSRMADLEMPGRGNWHVKDQMDPLLLFRVPADGEYLIGIEDGAALAGPDHVYRIEVEPVHDSVFTHITAPDGYQSARLSSLAVPRANRLTVDVQIGQGFGNTYKGELELEAKGLPSGVTMIASRVPKGVQRIPVQFVATAAAEPQSALIQILAHPVDPAAHLESRSRQVFALTNRPGELPWHFVTLDRFALALTDPAPFEIEIEDPGIPISQSGELLLKVKAVRHDGFTGAIEIQPDWLPPGIQKGGAVTIPAGKNEATFRIQADTKAVPGSYRIAMNATTTGGDAYSGVGRIRASSPFLELRVSEPYLSIELDRTSIERGKQSEITGILKHNKPFPGKATVQLQQLPNGVKLLDPLPEITSKDARVIFHIAADPDALAGLYKGLTCEITFIENAQTIRQHTGNGILRIDAPRTLEAVK